MEIFLSGPISYHPCHSDLIYSSITDNNLLCFQVAAGQLTMLYRDSLEEVRKASELSKRSGYQKSRSDLVSWIRGRRGRNISRCELLAFLTRDLDLDTRDPRVPETRDLSLPPASDPATQHALLQASVIMNTIRKYSNHKGLYFRYHILHH